MQVPLLLLFGLLTPMAVINILLPNQIDNMLQFHVSRKNGHNDCRTPYRTGRTFKTLSRCTLFFWPKRWRRIYRELEGRRVLNVSMPKIMEEVASTVHVEVATRGMSQVIPSNLVGREGALQQLRSGLQKQSVICSCCACYKSSRRIWSSCQIGPAHDGIE